MPLQIPPDMPLHSHTQTHLRSYLQCCALPEMRIDARWIPDFPITGHKSHKNYLSVQAEQWRRLETINPIEVTEKIKSWVETYIPQTIIDITEYEQETGERFSVPYPLTSRPAEYLSRPTDMSRLMSWIDNLPLMTVQRTMHFAFPDTEHWSFQHDNKWEVDSDIFAHFTWELRDIALLRDAQMKRDAKKKSVVVAVQPPWILSEMDMKQFSNCKSFPPYHIAGNAFPVTLVSKHRVWAKLWDLCVQKESHWFILTSYNQWVFGAFSPGWTTAFATKVFNFDEKDPSVILHLVFWIASAMRLPGTCTLTKVPEPIHCILNRIQIPAVDPDIPKPANSESAWDGKSIEPGSSAGVWSDIAPSVSDMESTAGFVIPRKRVEKPGGLSESIQKWISSGSNVSKEKPTETYRTVVKKGQLQKTSRQGEWLF